MKILISGFKPYGIYSENVTEKIVAKLSGRKEFRTIVFPVEFDERIFLNAIEKYKPDILLSLGQHPRASKIRIERRAVNLRQARKNEKPQKIEADGPKYRFVNFKLRSNNESCITYDAGKYVCNFSMYIFSQVADSKGIKFAFLHIPKEHNVNKAVKFIVLKINEAKKRCEKRTDTTRSVSPLQRQEVRSVRHRSAQRNA